MLHSSPGSLHHSRDAWSPEAAAVRGETFVYSTEFINAPSIESFRSVSTCGDQLIPLHDGLDVWRVPRAHLDVVTYIFSPSFLAGTVYIATYRAKISTERAHVVKVRISRPSSLRCGSTVLLITLHFHHMPRNLYVQYSFPISIPVVFC